MFLTDDGKAVNGEEFSCFLFLFVLFVFCRQVIVEYEECILFLEDGIENG